MAKRVALGKASVRKPETQIKDTQEARTMETQSPAMQTSAATSSSTFASPTTRKATFVLREETLLGLKVRAAQKRRSMAAIVEELLTDYLRR